MECLLVMLYLLDIKLLTRSDALVSSSRSTCFGLAIVFYESTSDETTRYDTLWQPANHNTVLAAASGHKLQTLSCSLADG